MSREDRDRAKIEAKNKIEALQEALLESGMIPKGYTGKLTFDLSQGAVIEVERREKIKVRG